MPPATSILSPLAPSFVPSRSGYQDYASFAAIYNEGVPEGVVVGTHADHEILRNIPDEAIDEIFPPTAADAAELDATDDFLRQMVDLSFLEENEEKTRANYSHLYKMRWEARRQLGLRGKPYKVDRDAHGAKHDMRESQETKLVHFDRHRRSHANVENKYRAMNSRRHQSSCGGKRSMMLHGHGHAKPIQQPRKMN